MSIASNPNVRACCAIAQELQLAGVTDVCISPGSRSTPLVMALERTGGIRPWVILDERCAAFFALGMSRETQRPVALVCTSGTAAANYAPAVAEASLERVPLVAITADRPPELRDCHAPQTIDQVRLYGSHVRWAVDAPSPSAGCDLDAFYRAMACRAVAAAMGPLPGPVQINLPMREPLIDVDEELSALSPSRSIHDDREPHVRVHRGRTAPDRETLERFAGALRGIERGIIVCGPDPHNAPSHAITGLGRRLGWPILADPLSGLRWGHSEQELIVDAYDVMLRDHAFVQAHRPEAVLLFGLPPVSKVLTEFLGSRHALHVVLTSAGDWPDPSHNATDIVCADSAEFCLGLIARLAERPGRSIWLQSWIGASRAVREAIDAELARDSGMFEGKVFQETVRCLPEDAMLQVGNSMPVRDLDTFLGSASRSLPVYCNRGANGIDGVVSAAMGAAAKRSGPTVLVVGDLSFLHDIGALQIAARHRIHIVIVVINNNGGGIFSFLPQAALEPVFERFFGTPHGLSLQNAAAMGGGSFARAASWDEYGAALRRALADPATHVIEVPGDRQRNLARHREIIGTALRALHPLEGLR